MKAIIFIDVQNDFVTGALANPAAQAVVPKIVAFAKQCVQDNECKLYATRDTHDKTVYTSDTDIPVEVLAMSSIAPIKVPVKGYLATLEGKKLPVEHCIEGTDGWQIVTDLLDVLLGNCTFINKPTFGSFDLIESIEEHNLKAWDDKNYFDEIVLCGFCTSICVAANAVLLRAAFTDTRITVLKDLCADVTEEAHNAALTVLKAQQIDIG